MRAESAVSLRARSVAAAAGILAMLIGGGHVIAWVTGLMASIPPSTLIMKTNAGLGFVLCGLALVLLASPHPSPARRRIGIACAVFALALGAATLSEHLLGWNLRIDELIATEHPGVAATVSPNRMGPPACLSLILLGTALLLLARRDDRRRRALHEPLALVVALLGMLSIIGHLYGVNALYHITRYTAIAWPTALSIMLLAFGVLCARPDEGLMARVTADDPGGTILRALIGPMIVLPLALGWFRLTGERLRWFDAPMGTALMMLLFMVIVSSLLLFASRRVSVTSAALRQATERERFLADVVETAVTPFGVGRPDGRIGLFNRAFAELTGYSREELESSVTWAADLTPPEWREIEAQKLADAVRRREPVRYEKEYLRKDGSRVPIELFVQPVFDDAGNVLHYRAFLYDISERKRAADSLQRERTLLRGVMSATDVMLVYFDIDFNFVWVNAAYAETCRMRPQEMVGQNHFALYPDAENEAIFRRVRDTGEPVFFRDRPFEFPDQPERGVTYWDWSLVPAKDAAGKLVGLVFSLRETTKFKRAENAVLQSQERLRRLVAASTEALGQLTREGVLQVVADAARDLTGARNVAVGHSYERRQFQVGAASRAPGAPACPEDQTFLMEKGGVYEPLVAGEDVINLTDEQMRSHPLWWGLPDAHVAMRGLLGARLVARDGSTSGMILATDKQGGDFTAEDEHSLRELAAIASLSLQQTAMRNELEEANRRKNEFLALLSHELRNPLAAVRAAIFILERVPPGGERAKQATAVIDRQAAQLTRLVDDLLDVTRITRGRIQLQLEPVDVSTLVRRTAEDHRALFATGGVDLEVEVPDEPLWVKADAQRLAQAVGNLLHNAAKFTDRGGRSTVIARRSETGLEALVTVADTGMGMDPQTLGRLFEPFMQADSTIDRARGGLGLGLALVKSLVEMHGGSVSAHSAGLGQGAAFTIRLPLHAVASVASAEHEEVARQSCRVLIIEDNTDAAESLCVALELNGHDVEVAYDGPEGIAKARRFRPEIILCDIGLPGMNGYDVARVLRADRALASVSLIALTGYALPEDLEKARLAGFDLHVAKPPDPEKLEQTFTALRATRRA